MTESQIVECCICMDDIIGDINKTTTECGHIFHCSCLMKNTAHNGYGCPYCRTVMAEPINDSDDEDDYEYDDEYDEDEDEDNDNVLTTFRMFHQAISGEEVEDEPEIYDEAEAEDEDEIEKPTTEYIANKLIEQGVSIEDLVKCLLLDHSEYEDDEQYDKYNDRMFGQMRIIISNYTPTSTIPSRVQQQPPSNITQRTTSIGRIWSPI